MSTPCENQEVQELAAKLDNLTIKSEDGVYRGACPHCDGGIEVLQKQINCKIFRHGVFKNNGQQVPPHAAKEQCDQWVQSDKIWGCGKPYRFDPETEAFVECGYI